MQGCRAAVYLLTPGPDAALPTSLDPADGLGMRFTPIGLESNEASGSGTPDEAAAAALSGGDRPPHRDGGLRLGGGAGGAGRSGGAPSPPMESPPGSTARQRTPLHSHSMFLPGGSASAERATPRRPDRSLSVLQSPGANKASVSSNANGIGPNGHGQVYSVGEGEGSVLGQPCELGASSSVRRASERRERARIEARPAPSRSLPSLRPSDLLCALLVIEDLLFFF